MSLVITDVLCCRRMDVVDVDSIIPVVKLEPEELSALDSCPSSSNLAEEFIVHGDGQASFSLVN